MAGQAKQPLVQQLPGYLKDTNHLLNVLKDFKWENSFSWVTCDVVNLYSSILHDRAVLAVSYLETSTDLPVEQQEYILEVLEYLLSHNNFFFDGGFYLQRCGDKFSLSLAKLYMGRWEWSCIFGGENPFTSSIKLYLRYIDDLILIMEDGISKLILFLEYLNCNNKNLAFTGEANEK